MLQYHEILRLIHAGYNQSQVSLSTGHSRGSILKVIERVKALELSIPDLLSLDDSEVEQSLFPDERLGSTKHMPDFEALRAELKKPGVTKSLLWNEYMRECSQLNLPQFLFYFHQNDLLHNSTMHVERKPGIRLEVDWSGDHIVIFNGSKEKKLTLHIFVAVLSYSQYTYVEAFIDEKIESWINAHIHALEFFGGVPREIVPDNCKTAVIENSSSRLELNKVYQEMAEHYGTIILPARVRHPKDKPNAESGVANAQRLIVAPLRNQEFFSLAEYNLALRNKLDEFNAQNFQKKDGSRRSMYEEDEKELLMNLPSTRYQMATWKVATVQYNNHVSVERKMYSVPFGFIGNKVDVKIGANQIEIYSKKGSRLAVHKRSFDPKERYVTNADHLPKEHQIVAKWNSKSFREWGQRIGESTHAVIDHLLSSAKVEQHAYKSCMAILTLSKMFTESLLELACKEVLALGHPSLKAVKTAINSLAKKKASTKEPDGEENPYGVTRGSKYYDGGNK